MNVNPTQQMCWTQYIYNEKNKETEKKTLKTVNMPIVYNFLMNIRKICNKSETNKKKNPPAKKSTHHSCPTSKPIKTRRRKTEPTLSFQPYFYSWLVSQIIRFILEIASRIFCIKFTHKHKHTFCMKIIFNFNWFHTHFL